MDNKWGCSQGNNLESSPIVCSTFDHPPITQAASKRRKESIDISFIQMKKCETNGIFLSVKQA